MSRKVFEQVLDKIGRMLKPVSLIVASAAAWMAFLAYHEFFVDDTGLSPALSLFTAGAVALACGVMLHLLFLAILEAVPAMPRERRAGLIPYIIALSILIACFSTYANLITAAGNVAMKIHEARYGTALEETGGQIQSIGLSIGQMAPGLAAEADRLRLQASCEENEGCLTGAKGRGDLTAALHSAAGKIGGAATSLLAAQEAIAKIIPQVNDALAKGDEIAVRSLIASMRSAVPFDALATTASSLRADLGITGTARNADVRARQNEAIARLQQDLASTAGGIDEAIKRVGGSLAAVAAPEREPISKARAILLYWDQLVPQIALAISIDWVLIIIAFFLAKIRDAMPAPDDDVSDISLADVDRISREWEKLKTKVGGYQTPPVAPIAPDPAPARSAPANDQGFREAAE